MVGMGSHSLHITSWGWREVNDEQWRLWRVTSGGELLCELVLPTHSTTTDDVYIIATAIKHQMQDMGLLADEDPTT